MSLVERTSTSWFSRIGGALTGALIGLALLIGAVVLLFWNEGRSVATYQSLQEGLAAVVSTDAAKVDPALEGKLVHIQSKVMPNTDAVDPETGVTAPDAIGLVRNVEMYQWVETESTKTEKKLGGSEEEIKTYSYNKEWSNVAVASSQFKQPQEEANPDFWLPSSTSYVDVAMLGAFNLTGEALAGVATRKPHPISADEASAASETLGYPGEGRAVNGALYFGESEDAPAIGDTKITFEEMVLPEASVVGMQNGTGITPYITKNENTLFLLEAGRKSVDAMFAGGEADNATLTWLIRAGGIAALFFGFLLIFNIFSVLGDVIPIVGSIVGFATGLVSFVLAIAVGGVVIAIGWLFVRPLLSAGLLIAAGAIVFAYFKYGRKKTEPLTA
jgi:hypothetical protein